MKNITAIMRRDLAAYFSSPIGYIFMMVFVTISVGLYISSFFTFPVADMRPYFDNLPLLLCVFIPAVTMRIWAEERKENTWEMLLTFPMKAQELVLGKFFASFIFFALTLAATVTVPAMLFSLGRPDVGVIFGGYFGTLFLGAFFLSLGIFFSGFFKDQIVAFVVTLLMCFLLFLLGTEYFATLIDDKLPGVGSLLSRLLGLFSHYGAFTRGVVDLADIVYFLAWTIIFIVLNILYIDERNRPGAKTLFATAVAVCLVIGLLFNYLMVGKSLLRFDLTHDKIYTISKASNAILSEVDTPVQVKVYITPKEEMPTGMKDLQQQITDKLEEMRVSSKGKIEYTTVPMRVANAIADEDADKAGKDEKKGDEGEATEKRMLKKGVQPFGVQAMSSDEVSQKYVYSSIGVGYKDKPEEIIPQVVPQMMEELEYRLVSTIYKLTREKPPVVALVAPKEAVNMDPRMRQMLMQMGQDVPQQDDPYVALQKVLTMEKYDVKRVELTKESPLPEQYDTLAVINPRSLSDRQRWEINRAIHSGKNVILAVQNYEWQYQPGPNGLSVTREEEKPDINPLLDNYGLGINDDVLMDTNKVPLRIQGGGNSLQDLMGQTVNLPMHILVNNTSMDTGTSITSRLPSIFYLWGSALKIDDAKLTQLGLEEKTLMTTSENAWTVPSTAKLTRTTFEESAATNRQRYPLMAMVSGQFPDAYNGKPRPAWPKPQQQPGEPPEPGADTPDAPETPAAAAPGKLILLGCAEMFRKNFLQAGSGNLDLFLNSVDAVTLNENLVQVRGRKPIDRTIDRPSDSKKNLWRLANYGLANIVIASIGIGLAASRRRSRNAYTMSHQQDTGKE